MPTRIDRDADTRQRIETDRPPPDDRVWVRADAPARLVDPVTFTAEAQVFRLAGLKPVERGLICSTPVGMRWACGLRASMALARILSGRVVGCRTRSAPPVQVTPPGTRRPIEAKVADCWLDGRPLAERVVAEGWALPADPADPALGPAAAAAERDRRGIHAVLVPE